MLIVVGLPASLGATNILANGNFETGDFTGWTLIGSEDLRLNYVGSFDPFQGAYNAYLGNLTAPAYILQTLSTIPGLDYDVSWWLHSDGGLPSQFRVLWGGQVIYDQTNLLQFVGQLGYAQFQFRETATGPSTVLELGGYDRQGWLYLDDVSVQPDAPLHPVPEPATAPLAAIGLLLFGGYPLVRDRAGRYCGFRRESRFHGT
ncbi:MAG TPA: hypothetical protein VFA33_10430 [Bryobacteraceae bacterium]|nr:hypothetical protein [Bryobacteraceae bacterium]